VAAPIAGWGRAARPTPALFSWLGVAVKSPATGELIKVNNLMSVAGMQWIFPNIIHNFSSFAPLGAILARTIKTREWDTPTKMGSIMAKWRDIVGPQVAEHTRIETFEGHRLVVRTDSTAWAKQLQLLLPTIERRIAEEVGSGVVEQVIIRGPVAPSWKKGPYVVRGRGPRADYG